MSDRRTRPTAATAFLVAAVLLLGLPAVHAAEPNGEIDLAITKVDSKDPVDPEEVFEYLIEVTNNGPSGAGNVVVTDTLPPEVAFIDASAECTWNGGRKVTCALGPMGPVPMAGSVRSLSVTVQVKPGVDDTTFLNVVRVENDEPSPPGPVETDNSNNRDDEPTTVNPGLLGSIGDYAWDDLDNDGLQDPGEAGIAGVTMQLSSGGAVVAQTETDADGLYFFTGLPAGEYTVVAPLNAAAPPLPGGTQGRLLPIGTNNPPGTYTPIDGVGAAYPVTLAAGENFRDADFGYWAPVLALPEVGNFVWLDSDGDGVQDPGEPGIQNATVTITNTATGASFVATTGPSITVTPATGGSESENYRLQTVAGTYTVTVNTSSVSSDLSLTTVGSYTVTLNDDDEFLGADFGFQECAIPCTGFTSGWAAAAGTGFVAVGVLLLMVTQRVRRRVTALR